MAGHGAGAVLAGRRILVAEDELLIAMQLEDLLSEQGCRILGPAATIEAALALLADRPDAVLLDGNLRGRISAPVAAEMRGRGIPFIVVSGYGPDQLGEPELAGAPWLRKPIDERALVEALAGLLREAPAEG